MFATKEPIGRYLLFAHSNQIFDKPSMENKINDLLNLIDDHVIHNNIGDLNDVILEKTFDLRLDVLELFAKKQESVHSFLEKMNTLIVKNEQLALFSNLAQIVSDILAAYHTIVGDITQSLSITHFNDLLNPPKTSITYHSFKILKLHPSPQIRFLTKWLEESLKLEVGLIIADLILLDKIDLSNQNIEKELIQFLKQTINRFGAYSIFTGFWTPKDNDHNQLITNMKILASILDTRHNKSNPVSIEEINQMLNQDRA